MAKHIAKIAWLLLATSHASMADPLDQQRKQFIKAETALRAGHLNTFNKLKKSLTNYPLYGYLEYWQLRHRLSKASTNDIEAFLDQYTGQPIATRMRVAWLHKLGKRRDWKNYQQFYQPQTSVTLQCYDVRSRLATSASKKDHDQALQDTLNLWLVGYSQPDACDKAFDQLYASKLINSSLLWKRIRKAIANNKPSLAGYLAKRLSAEDRAWVSHWQYAHRRPTAALSQAWTKQDSPLVREILTHAIKRLARYKPEQALQHWNKIKTSHSLSKQQTGEILKRIALYGALKHRPDASAWLENVPDEQVDSNIRQWRVRIALQERNWGQVLHWVNQLDNDERKADEWQYWRAHALQLTGESGDAFAAYTKLAGQRSYYGFLAADFLHRDYQMNDLPLKIISSDLDRVDQLPGITRARELYRSSHKIDARREWFYITQSLTSGDLKIAAKLAQQWGWHDRAILTAAQAKYWSDLTLRFPLAHRESVTHNAKQYELDPALIYGIIRQESAFMENARSSAGALGLMQLMPNTGKQTARSLNIRYRGKQVLLESELNIRLGSAYFRKLLNRYDDSPVLAAAAYNAGPHRVSRWLPGGGPVEASLWIEQIPFKETRKYVRRVLAYTVIFNWRLGQPLKRLSKKMPVIQQQY